MWQSWVNSVIGVWVLISGFYAPTASGKTNLIISGSLIIIFGLWGAFTKKK